jgi:transcriptional regulator with XRE-family HTH domain
MYMHDVYSANYTHGCMAAPLPVADTPDMSRRATAHPELRAIGARMKAVRESGGWTQEQLAEAIGVTPHTISQYERGEQSPRLTTLLRMAGTLQVRPGALIDVDLPSPIAAPPPEAADLLTLYRALSESDRALVTRIVRDVASSRRA